MTTAKWPAGGKAKSPWRPSFLSRPHRRTLVLGTAVAVLMCLDQVTKPGFHTKMGAKRRENIPFPNYVTGANVVKRELKSEADVLDEVGRQLPNVPVDFLERKREVNWRRRRNRSCAKIPKLYELKLDGAHWQEFPTANGTLYLYRAYHDRRVNSIRILSMMDRIEPAVAVFCQFWYEGDSNPAFSKIVEFRYIWISAWGNHRSGILQPYLLTCPLPKNNGKTGVGAVVPAMVSLSEDPCDKAYNALSVYGGRKVSNATKTMDFAVCVKGMDFPTDDLSWRLAEWFEVLRELGAAKIFRYELSVHENVKRLLGHYARDGLVDLTPLALPGPQPNNPLLRHLYLKARSVKAAVDFSVQQQLLFQHKITHKRQNEVIPYNDCLYRNLNSYNFVVLLDIDEVIVPLRKILSWRGLLAAAARADDRPESVTSSYCFRNVYFLDDMVDESVEGVSAVPRHLHMMKHVIRSANYSKPGAYVKCFHKTAKVKTLHNHYPFSCLGACHALNVPERLGHLQHYRAGCVGELRGRCKEMFKDRTRVERAMWKFKAAVEQRTGTVLKKLQLL